MSEHGDSRKRVFWRSFAAATAVVLAAEAIGFDALRRHLGLEWDRLLLRSVQPVAVGVALAALAASYVCRRVGLPLSSRSTETLARRRKQAWKGDDVRIEESGAARWLPWMIATQFMSGASSLVCLALPDSLWESLMVYAGMGVTVAMFVAFADARATAVVGRDGIRRRSALRRRWRTIPWEQIGSCIVETTTEHAFGDAGVATCVFRDRTGKLLLRIPVSGKDEEGIRFVDAVRACYGPDVAPSELMASDAPEGTGLEPEAAAAPAGTGTEVEAAAVPAATPGAERLPGTTGRGQERA